MAYDADRRQAVGWQNRMGGGCRRPTSLARTGDDAETRQRCHAPVRSSRMLVWFPDLTTVDGGQSGSVVQWVHSASVPAPGTKRLYHPIPRTVHPDGSTPGGPHPRTLPSRTHRCILALASPPHYRLLSPSRYSFLNTRPLCRPPSRRDTWLWYLRSPHQLDDFPHFIPTLKPSVRRLSFQISSFKLQASSLLRPGTSSLSTGYYPAL